MCNPPGKLLSHARPLGHAQQPPTAPRIFAGIYLRITNSASWMESGVRHGGLPSSELTINTAQHSSIPQAYNASYRLVIYRIDLTKGNLVLQSQCYKAAVLEMIATNTITDSDSQ